MRPEAETVVSVMVLVESGEYGPKRTKIVMMNFTTSPQSLFFLQLEHANVFQEGAPFPKCFSCVIEEIYTVRVNVNVTEKRVSWTF